VHLAWQIECPKKQDNKNVIDINKQTVQISKRDPSPYWTLTIDQALERRLKEKKRKTHLALRLKHTNEGAKVFEKEP
jgi:hypothetical protein